MLLKKQEKRKCKKCGVDFLTQNATRQCQECRLSGRSTKKANVTAHTIVKKKVKKKEPSRSKLKKELDRVFSIYIRQREVDSNGFTSCVCCGVKKHYSELQNGHYVGRANMWLRWDERNCWPSCVACNIYKFGNYPGYTQYLLNRFGMAWLQNLIREGEQTKKWTLDDLKERIEFYKSKIKV